MSKIKTLFIFSLVFLMAEFSYARLPWTTDPNGPYLCIHEESFVDGTPPVAFAFGIVYDSYDTCPVYHDGNPNNIPVSSSDLANTIFDEEILATMPGFTGSEIPHRRSDSKDPSCRIGVLYN